MLYDFAHDMTSPSVYKMSTPTGYTQANSYRMSDPAPANTYPSVVHTIINACGGRGLNLTKASAPTQAVFTHEFQRTGPVTSPYTNGTTANIQIPTPLVGGILQTAVTVAFTNISPANVRVGNSTTNVWTAGGEDDDNAWALITATQTIGVGPTNISLPASNYFGFFQIGLGAADSSFTVSASNITLNFDSFIYKFNMINISQCRADYNSQSSANGDGVWSLQT